MAKEKKSKLQKVAEVVYKKILENHSHYFQETYSKTHLEKLKMIKFDKYGNVVPSQYSDLLTFSYKTIYRRWKLMFEEAKRYVKNRI